MKAKLTRVLAPGLVLGIGAVLTGCASAPPQEQSIIEAVHAGALNQPQSCEARNAATVCMKTMRLNQNRSCECVDRRQFTGGSFGF